MDVYELQRQAMVRFLLAMTLTALVAIGAWELGKYLLYHLALQWR